MFLQFPPASISSLNIVELVHNFENWFISFVVHYIDPELLHGEILWFLCLTKTKKNKKEKTSTTTSV